MQSAHPGIPVYADAAELVTSPDVDAIAVITPVTDSVMSASAGEGHSRLPSLGKRYTPLPARSKNVFKKFLPDLKRARKQ
jgi:hypothetical protein